ncbi:MAG: hypothetical protein AABY15_07000 [Nanoarchaeota archaeon]
MTIDHKYNYGSYMEVQPHIDTFVGINYIKGVDYIIKCGDIDIKRLHRTISWRHEEKFVKELLGSLNINIEFRIRKIKNKHCGK